MHSYRWLQIQENEVIQENGISSHPSENEVGEIAKVLRELAEVVRSSGREHEVARGPLCDHTPSAVLPFSLAVTRPR
jgi:hypothetical protein